MNTPKRAMIPTHTARPITCEPVDPAVGRVPKPEAEAEEPHVFAFSTGHVGGGAYSRRILRLPESVAAQYVFRERPADMAGLAAAEAEAFVMDIVARGEP
jgi:hypothetical protein